jgi:hypothetical protein
MPISKANSVSFGFTGQIDSNSPVAGSDASLSAAAPDDLQEAVGDVFGDAFGEAVVDHAQVDAALSRIMGMSVQQAASAGIAQPPRPGGGGAMAVLAVLRARDGVC